MYKCSYCAPETEVDRQGERGRRSYLYELVEIDIVTNDSNLPASNESVRQGRRLDVSIQKENLIEDRFYGLLVQHSTRDDVIDIVPSEEALPRYQRATISLTGYKEL